MSAPEVDDNAEWLAELLPKVAHKHIPEILRYFGTPEQFSLIDVPGTRMPVERVEAYGLTLHVDANGRAAFIEFPDGASVASGAERW